MDSVHLWAGIPIEMMLFLQTLLTLQRLELGSVNFVSVFLPISVNFNDFEKENESNFQVFETALCAWNYS